MTIKHRGVKIVPVKTTRYEVRTVDNRVLKTFSTTSGARHWIDGYSKAIKDFTPIEPAKVDKPKRRRQAQAPGQPATQAG
jgi:hypothetical protein